jgi:peptidoglycan hydrolase-like protein with peptidoglycan-binding domain
MPKDTLVCLFVRKGAKMEHTGFGYNNETVECSVGVQHFTTRNKKWTDWGIPACIDGVAPPAPEPSPEPTPEGKPTLHRGDKGEFVTLAQTKLIQKGFDCGSFGADGQYGAATEKAVREFQKSHTDQDGNPLTVDGVIGQKTWAALDAVEPVAKYTVTIPHLSKSQADALTRQYPGTTITEERGEHNVY